MKNRQGIIMEKICIIASEFRGDYNDDFVAGAEKQANKLGYVTEIYTMLQRSELETDNEENIYKLIDYERFAGVIFVERSFARHKEIVQVLKKDMESRCRLPVMTIGSAKNTDMQAAISDDCSEMIETLTDHLIEVHDCKDILFLGGVQGAENGRRIEGFENAMKKHGLNCDEDNILYGGYWIDCAEMLAKNIAYGKMERPDAVMCINDNIAYALIKRLYSYGIRVPEDIRVTGFDGGECAYNRIIPITTIEADGEYVGRRAMCSLYEMMTGKAGIIIRPRLRNINTGISCGCGLKKTGDTRQRLEIQDKLERERMEFRNSHFEEKMFTVNSYAEMSGVLHHNRYLIPDCQCLGVSILDGENTAEIIHLTELITGDGIKYEASDILPKGHRPCNTLNLHVVPLMFNRKMTGFITMGFSEDIVYSDQAKEFIRILSNSLEILKLRKGYTQKNDEEDSSSGVISVLRDNFVCRVEIDNIIYMETEARKVYLYTRNGKYEYRGRMFEAEELLPKHKFMRISKSCIANLEKITSYRMEEDRTIAALTSTKETLRVSRGITEEFKKRIEGMR